MEAVLANLQVALALANTLAMALLASHFMTERRARRAARRLYERFERLRWALALMLAGIIVTAEVDALRWLGRFATNSVTHHVGQAAGYALLLSGLVLLHVVLLDASPGPDERTARRLAWRARATRREP